MWLCIIITAKQTIKKEERLLFDMDFQNTGMKNSEQYVSPMTRNFVNSMTVPLQDVRLSVFHPLFHCENRD